MIQHAVIFKLRYPQNSPQEKIFFERAAALAAIPGVLDFQLLKQTNTHNNYDYGIVMKFLNIKDYNNYSKHPYHEDFIQNSWKDAVDNFLEIDYEPLSTD